MSKIKKKVGGTASKKPAGTKPACEKRIPQFFQESDSIKAKFMNCALGRRNAATLTKAKMETTFSTLQALAKVERWGNNVGPKNFTFRQFRNYAESRKGKVSTRTIHNECSHIRRALKAVGREEFANVECSREKLGVENANRDGKAPAISQETLSEALGCAGEDIRVLILLSKAIGLRMREAVQCEKSLKDWQSVLERGQTVVVVRFGTKGGRNRSVCLCPEKAVEALFAVNEALKLIKLQGSLVVSKNLKSGLSSTHRRLKLIGLHGEESFHSLRREFAIVQYDHYIIELKLKENEALSRLASDLGHGEKRGRWVSRCYLDVTLKRRQELQKQQEQEGQKLDDLLADLI